MSTRMFKFFFLQSVLISSLFLSACTEGDRKFVSIPDVEIEEEPLPIVIKAAGVKGPLVNAEIGLYKLDLNTGLIKQHGDASEAFYRLLALANLNPDGSIPENAGTTEIEALVFIQDHIKALGYVTALPRLQSEIKESETTDQARLALNKYLDVAGEERETNAIPKAKVQKIFDNFATLGELKTKISSLSPFTIQLSELTSLSSAKSLINKFRASETDSAKEKGWLAIRNTFQNSTTSLSSLRSDLSDQFFALSDNNNLEEDSVALNRLDQLKQDVSVAATIEIAESLISQAITEEGNVSVRQSLSALKTSIISLDDFISQAQMDNALYHFAGIKNVILNQIARILDLDGNPILNPIVTPEIVLGDMYTASFNALSAELEPSLAEAFKNETLDFFGEPTNQLIKNVSGANSLLEGVNLGEYSGFVYMEVSSLSNTVDLNSGTKPIISTLNTIFHTDEIRGYGNNSKENRTLYFLKDGQEQRDSEGALITDLTMLEKNENNIILEVQPYRFATPLTKLAISLITERFKRFEPQLTDTNGDGELEYRITDSALKSELKAASNTIVKTFRLAELYDQSIYEAPAILTLPMQYSDADQENAVQHRAMIENFSAFINSLIQETNLNTDILFSAVVKDLLDNEMDGLEFDQEIESLNSVSDVAFLVKRSPTDVYIPGVNITINEIASLMSSQLKIVELEFPVPAVFDGNISFDPPRGGLDSDNDGYLNNTDTFPNDSTKHNDVGISYSGVWGLSVTNSLNFIVPFSGELSYSITRQEESAKASLPECDNVGESCLFEGDSGSDIDVSWEVIRGPESGNLQIKSTFSDNTAIGFNAIGSVPGVYQVRLKLVTVVEPVQTYSRIIPIKIMNPQDLEIRFNPEAPKAGEIVNVEFQATDEICRPYDFCDETQLGQYFDIENLSELTATWNINGGKSNQYRTFEQISDVPKVYFNTSNGETLNIDVVYSAGSTELEFVEFIAAKHSAVVGLKTNSDSDDFADDIDAFPNNSDCYRQTDGFVNDLGEETCNTNIINNETTPNPKSLTISLNDQIWLYDENWDRIFRTYSEDGETRFFDSIVMPRKNGVTNVVADFLVDEETRRVYIVYSDGEIDYFSFDDNQLHEFSDPHKNLPVASILPVGLVVLVEYKDGVEPSEFKLYQRNGDLSVIQAKSKYPKPGLPVEIDIDGNSITEFAQTFQLQWVLTRLVGDIPTDISVSTSDDSLVLLSGQTAYGDLLTVSFVDSDDVIVKKVKIAVLDTLEFNLEKATYKTTEILTILSGAYDLNSAETKKFIQVKWLKYDKIKDSNEFQSLDLSFPFSYLPSSAGAVNGDIITAEVYLKTGADSDLLLETEFALILEKELLDGFTFEYSQEPEFDPSDKESFQVQISKPTRDDKYFAEHFTPVWLLDGEVVEGENGLTFPSNSTTHIKFGSTLTLSFNYQIGSTAGTTPETEVITFDLDILITEYQLFPTFPEPGDDITIDFEDFEAGALIQYVPKWFINGEEDKSAITLTYPGEGLKFGDHIELRLSEKDRNPDDELLPQAFTDTAEIYVGLNVFNPSLEAGIDSDGDTVLNKNDYFRYDAACFAESDGNPDDMDGDGLSDLKELLPGIIIANRTNPNAVDSDGDGLTDYEELNPPVGFGATDPNNADTDGDKFSDGREVKFLGTDPNDGSLPVNSPIDIDGDGEIYKDQLDLDRDGILDEDELVLGTFVNNIDSDNDGLLDGMELKIGTDPLNPDSDGDGLSDGLEVYVTLTNPLATDIDGDGILDGLDTDGDTIPDGVEVSLLNFNPNDVDTDDNGIPDSEEDADENGVPDWEEYTENVGSLAANDFINVDDLTDYRFGPKTSMVPAGTCYSTWLGQQEMGQVVVSHKPQTDTESEQQILFTKYEWPEIIRYDAQKLVFLPPLTEDVIKGNITAVEYDIDDMNVQYLGYVNGKVRRYDSDPAVGEPKFIDVFDAGTKNRIHSVIDPGGNYLLIEIDKLTADEVGTYRHLMIPKFTAQQETVNSDPAVSVSSHIRYKNSIWLDKETRTKLLYLSDDPMEFLIIGDDGESNAVNTRLITEVIDVDAQSITEVLEYENITDPTLKTPMFIEELGGESALSFATGRVFSFATSDWLLEEDLDVTDGIDPEAFTISAFEFGLQRDSVRITVPTNTSQIKVNYRTSLDTKSAWESTLQTENDQVLTVVPVGIDTLVISHRKNGITQLYNQPPLAFELTSGDFDKDGLSDRRETELGTDIANSDSDGDGLTDGQEEFTTNTDPLISNLGLDSDGDGLTDSVELNQTQTNINSTITDTDDQNADFDNDGLSNIIEVSQTLTNPSLSDSNANGIKDGDEDFDLDGLTNLQELNSTLTSLIDADVDDNGTLDGDEDRDGDRLSDSLELNHIDPETNLPFYDFELADSDFNAVNDGDEDFDGDALTNRVEVESTNTDPWVADTDGDGINDGAEDRDSDGLSDSQELSTLRFDFENADSDANGTNDGDEDTDDDGLKNSKEFQFSLTSYLTGDSDGDGLSDYAEVVTYGTNPLLKDTDGDSIEDKVEIEPTIPADPASDPTSADADGDGLTDPVELDFKSNPKLSDTDGDGLDDKFEFEFVLEYSESELEAYGYDEEIYSIDPNLSDTDGDDFTDAEEVALTYNPALSDTDNDNLSDYVEHHGINGFKTNPKLRDTDGDGLNDGDEILKTMTDPLDTDSNDNGILDGDEDSDQDGLSDKAELYLTLTNIEEKDSDGNGIEDGFEDPDNDNLNNLAEIELKTNPHLVDSDDDGVPDDKESAESALNPDTDGDGLTDGDEVNPPEGVFDSDPNLVDTDGDGLPDNEERKSGSDPRNVDTDNDFLLDGDDLAVSLLNWDADSDGIPDGIERHFLNTSPTSKDSDQDGLPDNEEVWVYAIPENEIIGPDGLISENQLVRIGMNVTYEVDGEEVIGPNVKLNSRFGDANFIASKFSNNDKDRKVMTVTRVNSVNDPNTNENVTLYIRSISSPDKIDTDGDELSDFTELMQIEREFAPNSFDPNVGTSGFDPGKLNSENFMISDPWVVDTDNDGISDGEEDIDEDFYSNVLEQGDENSDVVNPHSDVIDGGGDPDVGDGILDGIEVLLLSSSPGLIDSDDDDLDDNEEFAGEASDYDPDLKEGPLVCRVANRKDGSGQDVACFDDFSTLPVVSNPCRETEVILSNIAGVSYCFKVNFDSLPSEVDSDNDGVEDKNDAYALDPNCAIETDGFLDVVIINDLEIIKKHCFSSWMAQQTGISQIDNAQWVDDALEEKSQLAFFSEGWDKVVRFDTVEASYVTHIAVDMAEDAPTLVKVGYSALSRRLYLAYADGNIKYIDLVSGAEFELVAGYLDVSTKQLDTIVVAGTNVIVQLKDATKYSHFIYNAAGQQALGALAGADDFNLKEAFWDQVSSRLYGFQQAVGQAISNLGFVNIDEVNNRFDGGIIYSSSLSAETGLSGPIALSQDGVSVYLGSGQKRLAALGENDDIDPNLVKTYKTSTFTRFRELIELGDHFVGVVDIKEGSDQVNPPIRNGLFIQDIADLSASGAINNRYLFKKNENKEILKLVPFIDVDPELIFVSKYPNRVVIDSLGLKDEDGDGMTGIYETFYNLDDADAGDRFSDPDEDFLTNIEEFNLATNPTNEDTDGDSWHDADEVINATNPLDAADF